MISLPDQAKLLEASQEISLAAADLPDAPLRMPEQDLARASRLRLSMRDLLWPPVSVRS